MPKSEFIDAITPEMTAIRRDLHRIPELLFDVHRTAEIVAERLRAWGVDEVVTGLGRTGVVGIIRGKGAGSTRVIGLRADMDALPLQEETNLEHSSTIPGKMHACGHDGHTAMLLGAAKYLTETRDFDGTAVVIFQPAEEGGAGGQVMCGDGLMERFGIEEVYGMHNMPGLPLGQFAIRKGGIMAASDLFLIKIEGRGGHAAQPHKTIDPLIAACQMVTALQSIASRNADPLDSLVVSVTSLQVGEAFNVIPQHVTLKGTVRTLSHAVQDLAEQRLREIVVGVSQAFCVTATVDYQRYYPLTFNHPDQTDFVVGATRQAFGSTSIDTDVAPSMGGEDFSFMLQERPGAYIFMGNGDSAGLHNPAYDFNDDAIPYGIAYWACLVESAMPRRTG